MTTCCYEGCSSEWSEYVVFTPVNTELGYCSQHAEVVRRYFHQEHDEDDLLTQPRDKSLEKIEEETQLVGCGCGSDSFFAMRVGDDLELRCTECAKLRRPLRDRPDDVETATAEGSS